MLQLPDAADRYLVSDLFSVIEGMDVGNPRLFAQNVMETTWGDRMAGYYQFPATQLNPAAIAFTSTSKVIFVLRGVSHAAHIPNVMTSVMSGPTNNPSLPFTDYADRSSDWFLNNFFDEAIPGSRDTIILGHSYGGGVALPLAVKLRQTRGNTRVRLIQVAAPRVATQAVVNGLGRRDNVFWQNDGDAVPTIMPTATEAAPFELLYSNQAAQFAASRSQMNNCRLIIQQSGGVEERLQPYPPVGAFNMVGILAWAFCVEKFTGENHSRSSYSTSLRLMIRNSNPRAWGEAAAVPVAVGGGHSLTQGVGVEEIDGGPWTDTQPTVAIAQGMELVATPPPALAGIITGSVKRKSRKKEIILEGIVVGSHHRGTLRRNIRRSYARLKRLCSRCDEFAPGTLAGIVSKWPSRP